MATLNIPSGRTPQTEMANKMIRRYAHRWSLARCVGLATAAATLIVLAGCENITFALSMRDVFPCVPDSGRHLVRTVTRRQKHPMSLDKCRPPTLNTIWGIEGSVATLGTNL
jgi:hypothetical protein